MRSSRALLACLPLLFSPLIASGCNLDNLGDPPPDADIYLPTGLLLSAQTDDSAPRLLYVINSNFDLRYNRGSLQAFDLDVLDEKVQSCVQAVEDCKNAPAAQGESGSQIIQRCEQSCVIEASYKTSDGRSLLADEVLIPSLATSYSVSPDRSRMYVATRTDASITFIDLDESADGEEVLDCGDSDAERRCSDDRRRGWDPTQSPRSVTLPTEPVDMVSLRASDAAPGLDADLAGEFLLVAHRGGEVSLFFDPGDAGPRLLDVLQLGQSPLEPTGIDFDVQSHFAYLSNFARGAVTSAARQLSRVALSVESDGNGSLDSSYAYSVSSALIDGVASFADTRAVRLNPAREQQLLVLGELPASLLFVDIAADAADSVGPLARVLPTHDVVSIGEKPLRMSLGRLGDRDVVAISCFDAGQLYLIDVESAAILAVIHNLNGPFDLGIDSARQRLYLSDFRASIVQVFDLSALVGSGMGARTDARRVAVLGVPKVVKELN